MLRETLRMAWWCAFVVVGGKLERSFWLFRESYIGCLDKVIGVAQGVDE
jgi:hypothetical protein